MSVTWKIPIYKADAEIAYKEISRLPEITPESVLELARDKKSEIHNDFEWNNDVAAEKYRLIQARKMIQMFVIQQEEPEQPKVRALQITTEKSVYQPTKLFLKQDDEYNALLKRALAELESFKQKYKTLSELEAVFEEIEKVL